jgi:hypothetical protein
MEIIVLIILNAKTGISKITAKVSSEAMEHT